MGAVHITRGRVLVVDGDEWIGNVLARVLKDKGYAVDVCTEAREGFRKACETNPDCVVCNPDLPDIDGVWLARRLRTEAGPIAKVPLLFVGEIDKDIRTQALAAGADVVVARPPASNDEVAAQVDALVAMARRLDGRKDDSGAPSSLFTQAALRGDLSAFPLASLLMMFEMERRSGTVHVVAVSGKRAQLTLADGLFASTEVGGEQRPALEVLREVLSWRAGRFSFQPKESGTLPAPRASVGALVLEAMRLEDEEKGPLPELSPDDLIEEAVKSSRQPDVPPAPPPPPKAAQNAPPQPPLPRPAPSESQLAVRDESVMNEPPHPKAAP
jgi:CheY-like chemotaxis protein